MQKKSDTAADPAAFVQLFSPRVKRTKASSTAFLRSDHPREHERKRESLTLSLSFKVVL